MISCDVREVAGSLDDDHETLTLRMLDSDKSSCNAWNLACQEPDGVEILLDGYVLGLLAKEALKRYSDA